MRFIKKKNLFLVPKYFSDFSNTLLFVYRSLYFPDLTHILHTFQPLYQISPYSNLFYTSISISSLKPFSILSSSPFSNQFFIPSLSLPYTCLCQVYLHYLSHLPLQLLISPPPKSIVCISYSLTSLTSALTKIYNSIIF